jgi:hypothetical protein
MIKENELKMLVRNLFSSFRFYKSFARYRI